MIRKIKFFSDFLLRSRHFRAIIPKERENGRTNEKEQTGKRTGFDGICHHACHVYTGDDLAVSFFGCVYGIRLAAHSVCELGTMVLKYFT